jgi:pSer/pThr/pTyr-binding forkhead associated (FHA) protein
MVLLGKTQMVFRTGAPVDVFGDALPLDVEPESEMTVVFQSVLSVEDHGPRLVVLGPDGGSEVHPLDRSTTTLGRADDVNVRLPDAMVSRKHARVEKRGDHFHVVRLSRTNPLLLNQKEVTDHRLYAGDELQIGPFSVSFVSDREEDRSPPGERIIVNRRRGAAFAWAALILAILAAAGYFGFHRFVLPWKQNRHFQELARQWSAGETSGIQTRLSQFLSEPLTEEIRGRTLELLAAATVAEADQLVPEGKFTEARSVLSDFMTRHGAEKESDPVQARLDQLRLQYGQHLVISGDPTAALREFSTITEESPHYDEAQRALSHIWSAYQKENVTELPLDQLMAEADGHFAAKRYTTPIGKNAYAIYQTVLALDPNNEVARKRIEEMKVFYREAGEKYSAQKNCASATVYFERYLLISPDDNEVKEMLRSCGRGGAGSDSRRRVRRAPEQESATQQRIDRILQDTESPEPRPSQSP